MLLNNILLEVGKGNIISYSDLAEKLNTDVSVIDAAIRQLCQMKYLYTPSKSGGSCGESCHGCSLSGSCELSDRGAKILTITESGNRYLKTLPDTINHNKQNNTVERKGR
jgi:hypothetical protein